MPSRLVLMLLVMWSVPSLAGPLADAEALWNSQAGDFIGKFSFPSDKAFIPLSNGVKFVCGPPLQDAPDAEYEIGVLGLSANCTAKIPTTDRTLCRAAAVWAVIKERKHRLRSGNDSPFSFSVDCADAPIVGKIFNYVPTAGPQFRQNGMLSVDQGHSNHYSMQVPWTKVAPDPSDPLQWAVAATQGVRRDDVKIAEFLSQLAKDPKEADLRAHPDDTLKELEGFSPSPDDDVTRQAIIAYARALIVDLEEGDLSLLKERSREDEETMALRKKGKGPGPTTNALIARWKKSSVARAKKFEAAINAYLKRYDE